jgi:hypothetical protein
MSILNDPNEAKALGITNANIPKTPENQENIRKRASNILAENIRPSGPTKEQMNATRRRRLVGSLPSNHIKIQKHIRELKQKYDTLYADLESQLSSGTNIQEIDKTYYKLQDIKREFNNEYKLIPATLKADASAIKSAINQNTASVQLRIKSMKDKIYNVSTANVPVPSPISPPEQVTVPERRSLANATRRAKGIRLAPIAPPALPSVNKPSTRASIPIMNVVSEPISEQPQPQPQLLSRNTNTPVKIENAQPTINTNTNTKKSIEYYAEKKDPHTIYRVKYNPDTSIHSIDLINYDGKWVEAVGMPHATFTAQKDLLAKIECPVQAGGGKQKRRGTQRKRKTRR